MGISRSVEEEKFTLNQVVSNPFTSIYWDYQTKTYLFCVCGRPIAQMYLGGKVISLIEKRVVE